MSTSSWGSEDEISPEIELQQVCSEKDLASIAQHLIGWEQVRVFLDVTEAEAATIKANHPGDYETQKLQILKKWKTKKGDFRGTFRALSEVFAKREDQEMVDVIKRVASEAYKESSENSVIELIDEFKAVNYEKLKAAALQVNMFTNTHLDAIKNAPNNAKKQEVILAALMDMLKPQLIHFIRSLATQGGPALMSMSPPPYNDTRHIEKAFRITVRNIKGHLKQCDVQDLVTNFNNALYDERFSNIGDHVKEKLFECESIKELFARISPFFNWRKREVLWALVEASDCQEAEDELTKFEAQLDYGQSVITLPISSPSCDILPDPESNFSIITAKANKDLRKSNLGDIDNMEDNIAQAGKISKGNLELQAKKLGSSILYWLIPKSMLESFEVNIRKNLDFLYDQGIVEISLDPNIVITTGRKLRVRSLAYLTKLPPKDAVPPPRAEELQEVPTSGTELPERAEEIMELAYQLKIDVRKREEEIVELDTEVKIKEQECNQLQERLTETEKQNEELRQVVEVATQSSKEETLQEVLYNYASHGIHSAQDVSLSFGIRGHTAVTCRGKVYIGGGVVSKNRGTPDVIQVIDLSAKHVFHLPACPVKHFTLVSIDNQVVTIGGKNVLDNQVSRKLYCWNEATQHWEEGFSEMATTRHFHTSVVWRNYLIVCGGRIDDEDTLTDSVEILNLQTRRWHTAASLPLKESGKHAVITESGKLYLLGGYLGNAVHYCELQKLVATTVTVPQPKEASSIWWRLEDTPSTDCAAALLRGSLVLIGGRKYETNKISSKILRYSNADKEWQHTGDLLFGRTACMAVALDYNNVLVIGGTVLYDQQPQWFSSSTEIITAN